MADYQQLSRIARSNFFPSAEIEWRTTTKTTFTNLKPSYHTQELRRTSKKDWLSQWGEKETSYRSAMKNLDKKQKEDKQIKGNLFQLF